MSVNILGLATAFPEHITTADDCEEFAKKWCEPSEGLQKTLLINRSTKILKRPHVSTIHDPVLNGPTPPTIKTVNAIFMDKGVGLAVRAAEKALGDWGGERGEITHLIANTCTASAYPGFDHAVATALGLSTSTDRTLLHGVGCAGGLSALRLATQLSRIPPRTPSSNPPRILVIATEITSTLVRSELDELDRAAKAGRAARERAAGQQNGGDGKEGGQGVQMSKEEMKAMEKGKMGNVGVCLFSDGASAMVVGGGDLAEDEKSSFEVIETVTETVPETVPDLGFNVDEFGWKAIISHRVPALTSASVPKVYQRLLSTALQNSPNPTSPPTYLSSDPTTHDWLIHPGGASILAKIENTLSLSPKEHTRASWEVYVNRGNTSSVSIGAVMERSRELGGKEGCVGMSFGPGVTIEGCLLRRTGWKGSKGGVAEGKVANGNGHAKDGADGLEAGVINGAVNGIINGAEGFTTGNR